ncbi:protease Do-like 1, chloroplastic [Primulina tabacum]|uniref:protease Do-like 1, chloroplastic n=1 Tax=Primulina tabacum TaxID=48773 RepID=UPI003F5A8607
MIFWNITFGALVFLVNSIVVVFRVTLADQSVYYVKVFGFYPDKDVVVMHIDAPKDKLRPMPIGVSADLLVGQKVYEIGNPFGLDHTLIAGVRSGLQREISSAATGLPIQNVIHIDGANNPAIYSPSGASSGVGFSIPIDTVGGIVDQLVKSGKVTRPILGIKFAPDQSVEPLGVSGVLVLDAPSNGQLEKQYAYYTILSCPLFSCRAGSDFVQKRLSHSLFLFDNTGLL